MKRYISISVFLVLLTANARAQFLKQTDTLMNHSKRIIPVDRATLLKNVDLIANMQYANNSNFQNGTYTGSAFALNQFRLEIKGLVFDSTVFFRFRNRYTRTPTVQSIDNIDHSVDMAFIGINLSKRFTLSFGKMCADYGGYEFDANPINIYQYNDIVEYADNFLTGAQFTWNAKKNQQFAFQVLNARTQSYTELYDSIPGTKAANFASAFVGNWRGSFGGGIFSTFWSYSFIAEANNKQVKYIALGNQLNLNKVLVQYDFKYMMDGLDRLGIVSGLIPKSYSSYTAINTDYIEHWLRVQYNFTPQWNITAIGMVDNALWKGNPDANKNNHIRTAWGFIPSLEFYPYKKLDLKFFAAYVGRYYDYTTYAKEKFGLANSTTGQLMFGFISPLKFL
jgi:hypothetical protein